MKEYLKNLIFIIYSLFFNLGASLGVKENRVGLVSMHNAHFTDGLGEVEAEFKYRDKEYWKFVRVERCELQNKFSALKFMTIEAFKLGRSRFIFLNDNFMPLAFAKPNEKTEIIQLWHGQGAFKKFGFDIEVPDEIRRRESEANKKLSYVVCSSNGVKPIYARAFGVEEDKVLALGSPNSDFYSRSRSKEFAKEKVYELFPELEGKKVILYAPTFREDNSNILNHIDFSKLQDADTYVMVRLHPQVNNGEEVHGAFDVTDYDNVNDLCAVADILITDYSSICMDFALQDKPVIYYAYDLSSYKGARDFYFDYESYVGGPVVKTEEELIKAVKELKIDKKKADEFKDFNFDNIDGNATERLIDFLLKK